MITLTTIPFCSIVGDLLAHMKEDLNIPSFKKEVIDNIFIFCKDHRIYLYNMGEQKISFTLPACGDMGCTSLILRGMEQVDITFIVDYLSLGIDSITFVMANNEDPQVYNLYFSYNYAEPYITYHGNGIHIELTSSDIEINSVWDNVEIVDLFIQSFKSRKSFHLNNYTVEGNKTFIPHHISLVEKDIVTIHILLRCIHIKTDTGYKTEPITEDELRFMRKV